MAFVIATFVLVAGITFFLAIHGTFSALIMSILTVLSAAIAVNYYGPLSEALLFETMPDYADPCCLGGLFLITLTLLRILADRLIRGNITFYPWADRIMSGCLSLPTALLLVGLSSITFQMLPFTEDLLLFNRFDKKTGERESIFPYADDFAAGFVGFLSKGSLAGKEEFGLLHPDWPGEVSAQRVAIQYESRHAVPANCIKVKKTWRLDEPLQVLRFNVTGGLRRYNMKVKSRPDGTRQPDGDNYYLVVRLELQPGAADPDGHYRFSWGQVRLVGTHERARQTPVNYYIVGFDSPHADNRPTYMRVKLPVMPEDEDEDDIDEFPERNYGVVSTNKEYNLVFEVREGFKPWFIEYKRWGRAYMPRAAETAGAADDIDRDTAESTQERREGKGWTPGFTIDYERTGFINELPFELTARSGSATISPSGEISAGRFRTGTIHGWIERGQPNDLDAQDVVIGEFDVPSDKRFFRIECRIDPAKTRLLRNIFGSVQKIVRRSVTTQGGKTYFAAGKYAMIIGDQGTQVELQYDPEFYEVRSGPQPFTQVSPQHARRGQVRVGFLFLIDPGVQLDSFEVGGRPFKPQDISEYTAP